MQETSAVVNSDTIAEDVVYLGTNEYLPFFLVSDKHYLRHALREDIFAVMESEALCDTVEYHSYCTKASTPVVGEGTVEIMDAS